MKIFLTKEIKAISVLLVAFLVLSCSKGPETKNTIFIVADGCSTSALSVARWYKQEVLGEKGNLYLDPFLCGYVRTSSAYSPTTGSSESMSAFMTGEKTGSGYVSMYPKYKEDAMIEIDTARKYQPLATLMEAAKVEQGKSVGIAVTVEYWHATPAACASHSKNRYNIAAICAQMASNDIDVLFGGGTDYLTPEVRGILAENGTTVLENDLEGFRSCKDDKLWSIWGEIDLRNDMDRDTLAEPSLAEMTAKALSILERNRKGFFLMVEGSRIDYAAHSLDAVGQANEILAFDKAVGVAMDYAKKHKNTTVVVLADHGTSGTTIGAFGYEHYGSKHLRHAFDHLYDYKVSAKQLSGIIMDAPVEQVRPLVKQYTGLDLTDEEYADVLANKDKMTVDYMKAAIDPTLQGCLAKIMASHTHVGFSGSGHTGEDVFLCGYHPNGVLPLGYHDNVEVCEYMWKTMGLKHSLRELSDSWFVKASKLFEGAEMETVVENERQRLIVRQNGHELVIPADHADVILDGKTVKVGTVSVFQSKEFYVNRSLAKILGY